MSQREVYHSLNKVFELMMGNKFREDMDDTLFEKLLSVIKLKISEDNSDDSASSETLTVTQDLLLNTTVLHLAEKVVTSLNNKTADISPTIQKFTIELIGILFGNKNVFGMYKDSIIFRQLSSALTKNVTTSYPPTVQSALLLCFTNISKHFEGLMWLKEQDLIQFVFSSFSSSSYHVRARAASFFTDVLFMWTPSNMSLFPPQEQLVLNNIFENIVLELISRIHLDGTDQENTTNDCCLLALKNSFEVPNVSKLVNNSSVLKQQLSQYFSCLSKTDIVNEKVLNLLLCDFASGGISDLFIQDILKLLTEHSVFASALDMVGSILRVSKREGLVSKLHIQFLTLPLKILIGNSLGKDMVDTFGLCCPSVYESMSKTMEAKSDCIKIIISSLLSLSKLADIMESDALEDTLKSIGIVVTGPTGCDHHPMSYVCLDNRRICFALSELISSVLNENVYSSLKFQSQLDITNYLMCFIENSFNYNVTTAALKLLGTSICLTDKLSILLPDEIKEKMVHLLCKKLMDKTEAIAICALSVAALVMSKDGKLLWKAPLLKHHFPQIVWEMGVDGIQDGMLKAASLHATLQACKAPHCWEDIQSAKGVKEEDVMKIFFRYYKDPDFYVQRESLTCISEWLVFKEAELPLTLRDPLLFILSEAMKSLDMDQKEIALKTWTRLIESDKFFPGAKSNKDDLLTAVCELGFASSLVLAIEDYDETIQYKAAEILIHFRKSLLSMGCTAAECNVAECPQSNVPQMVVADDVSFEPVSNEERDAGIENVMKLTTAEQIAKLAVLPDAVGDNSMGCVELQVDSLRIPVDSFLKYVWSSNLDCIVSKPDVSTDLFSEHTLSLLDDILASDVKDVCRPSDDIPDCY